MFQFGQEEENKYCMFTKWLCRRTRTIVPAGHEIDNFGRPFLGHDDYIISLYDLYLGVETKKKMYFHHMTYAHALTQEPVHWGSWNLQFY